MSRKRKFTDSNAYKMKYVGDNWISEIRISKLLYPPGIGDLTDYNFMLHYDICVPSLGYLVIIIGKLRPADEAVQRWVNILSTQVGCLHLLKIHELKASNEEGWSILRWQQCWKSMGGISLVKLNLQRLDFFFLNHTYLGLLSWLKYYKQC